jgi:hypothetical protein
VLKSLGPFVRSQYIWRDLLNINFDVGYKVVVMFKRGAAFPQLKNYSQQTSSVTSRGARGSPLRCAVLYDINDGLLTMSTNVLRIKSLLIWSMSRLQVSYKSSENMLGRQVDTVEPFMPKMLTHVGTVVSCAGIPYEVDSSVKEIFQNSIESSIIGVPGGHSDVIMGEMDLLNRRLKGVESKRNNSADDKSHILSELAGLQPHHESKLRTALRSIVAFFIIIIVLCSIFVVVRCYQSVKSQTNVSLAALRTNQLGRQFNQATL